MNMFWKFIVVVSPWWGSFWKHLVQSCKCPLQKVLFQLTVNYEEVMTMVTEIKGIINSRPLYNDNTEDTNSYDKPNNFDVENLTQQMKYLHTLVQHYWNHWKIEYLNELCEYHRCGKEVDLCINVGDIVLVEDPVLN